MAIEQRMYAIEEPSVASQDEIKQYLAEQGAALARVREGLPEKKEYKVVPANTYAQGVAKMRARGGAFTFAQNLDARVADHEYNGDDAVLFGTWLDSVTGVANLAGSTKFKVIPRAEQLEDIAPGFNGRFISTKYSGLQGVELDSADPEVKYNQPLTEAEVGEHPGWIAAAGGDKDKLKKYARIWFGRTGRTTGMEFHVGSETTKDELRALVLGYGSGSISVADGSSNLYDIACFASEK
jgi:hypothetical protein